MLEGVINPHEFTCIKEFWYSFYINLFSYHSSKIVEINNSSERITLKEMCTFWEALWAYFEYLFDFKFFGRSYFDCHI